VRIENNARTRRRSVLGIREIMNYFVPPGASLFGRTLQFKHGASGIAHVAPVVRAIEITLLIQDNTAAGTTPLVENCLEVIEDGLGPPAV
jgi:hypothetical protein